MSFLDRKKNATEALKKSIEKDTAKTDYSDPRFWRQTTDQSGNAYAVIRFLDAPDGETSPYARYYRHSFKGPTGLSYVEKSLTTFKQPDPVAEFNRMMWNSGREEDKKFVQSKQMTRKETFVSNIYVISDPAKPENEGKVFLYSYGKKIFEKITEQISPEFPDQPAVNIFHLWEGANFKLRVKKVGDFPNYDSCKFDDPTPLKPTDEEIQKIWMQCYPLAEFTDPSTFKSYDELKKRFDLVMSSAATVTETTKKHDTVASVGKSVLSSAPIENDSSDNVDDVDIDELVRIAKEGSHP